jgi:hypothetical protein
MPKLKPPMPPDPNYPKPEKSESRLQSDCFLWFHNTFPSQRQMLFHVQNKARNAIEGNKFKAMGVVKGVSDFILILPARVVFIELKVGDGIQSPEQVKFQGKVQERRHEYLVIRNLEQFKSFIMGIRHLFDPYNQERALPSWIG